MSKVCWSTGLAVLSWKSTVDDAPPAARPIKPQIINESSMEWMVQLRWAASVPTRPLTHKYKISNSFFSKRKKNKTEQ